MAKRSEGLKKGPKTLLLVDERGNLKQVGWWKGMWVFCWTALLILGAVSGGLYWSWQTELERNLLLQEELDAARRLAKKCASAEPRSSLGMPSAASEQKTLTGDGVPGNPANSPHPSPSASEPPSGDRSRETISAETSGAAAKSSGISPSARFQVAVEAFSVSRPTESELRIAFRIRNRDDEDRALSGHVVVVLEGDDIPMAEWRALPEVPLIHGRPDGAVEGETFEITNFKDIVLESPAMVTGRPYSTAVVYVFDSAGGLMLKEIHTIALE